MYYAIRVQGHLGRTFQDRFGGLCIEQQETGTTLLSLETSEAPGGPKAAEHL
jgi:hypothetical protein